MSTDVSTDLSGPGRPLSRPFRPLASLAPSSWFLFGATSLAAGLLLATASFTWIAPVTSTPTTTCLGCVLSVVGIGVLALSRRTLSRQEQGRQNLCDQFGRHTAALGYVMVLVGLGNAITAAGLIRNGKVELSGKLFETTVRAPIVNATVDAETRALAARRLGMLLLLSIEMSILGSLFFVANTMRGRRREAHVTRAGEPPSPLLFDPHRFWGGLLFRVGEAVLFTFTFFWLFWKYADSTEYTWLPIVGLFLGMFVKSGERVVFGIAERLLDTAAAFFPSPGSRDRRASRNSEPKVAQAGEPEGATS